MTPHAASFLAAAAVATLTVVTPSSAFVVPSSSQTTRLSSVPLQMSKNNDRARVEKNLEDMMGDDWRVFRARLVMQEQMESQDATASSSSSAKNTHNNNANHHKNHHGDEKLAKQGQLGEMFAGAISSIFSSKNKQAEKSSVAGGGSNKRNNKKHHNSRGDDIFNGQHVGGATSECEDPFVSEAELPILLKPKAQIDKHRWAHPIPHVEPGSVLIANEKLGGVFHQCVVLIIDHHETTGSTGIVINRYVVVVVLLCCHVSGRGQLLLVVSSCSFCGH